jgi:hypothetical protein
MTMQSGAVTYTPSNSLGNWTTLCQIPQQAKAIAVGAGQTDISGNTIADTAFILRVWAGTETIPGLAALYAEKFPGFPAETTYDSAVTNQVYNYMSGTTYFDNAATWYVEGLPKTAAGKSTGGIAPSTYTGSGKDYLDSYFRSGIMPTPSTAAPSGSSDQDANGQILMKTSAYWVAVTQVMYNLDMAEKNLAANNTAAAKANFDSAAAAYYGCGDTNPVPLPLYSGAPITYPTTASSTDTGFNATTMSIYGVANKRADNYGTAGLVSTDGGTCTVASATCKIVASLNVAVGAALTAGPTTANIAEIRDSVLTIFTQAAQRYVAKFTLAAHLPGNGMGGSTNPTTTTSSDMPITGSYIPEAIGGTLLTKKQPTACGGKSSYVWQGIGDKPGCGLAPQPLADGKANAKIAAAGTAVTGEFPSNDGCRQVTGVNACSVVSSIPLAGSPESNTATFASVQAEVKSATAAVTPFTMAIVGQDVTDANKGGGNTNVDITAATRGLAAGTALDSNTQPPIACVGPDVVFAEVTTCAVEAGNLCKGSTAEKQKFGIGLKLCNPVGLVPPKSVLDATDFAAKQAAYRGVFGAPGYGGSKDDYTGVKPGSAGPIASTADLISKGVGFWDPETVAMATKGAFCCNSLIYSDEGIGRKDLTGVPKPSNFVPPMIGGNLVAEATPGGMYDGGASVTGLSEYKNPTQENLLEGQAFYATVAPMQYTLQKTSTNTNTQKLRADKQKVCSETLTQMFKLAPGGTAVSTCQGLKDCAKAAGGTNGAETKCKDQNTADGSGVTTVAQWTLDAGLNCRGSRTDAITFPLWKVAIGGNVDGKTGSTDYFVPNAYCYANACFEDFADVGTQAAFKGKTKLAALVKSPDMSSAPTAASPTTSVGRANGACAAPPATWTGGAAEMKKCATAPVCTTAEIQAQTGRIPIV